jgi:putative sugar O-methyltransferase
MEVRYSNPMSTLGTGTHMDKISEQEKSKNWQENIYQRARELDQTYKELGLYPKDLGFWTSKHLEDLNVANFRSDNVYVWQKRDMDETNFLISFLSARLLDHANLFNLIKENGSFGVEVYQVAGVNVSRDLIDSVLEINFLIDIIGIEELSKYKVLDIGAGYGRLAKNLTQVFEDIKVGCIDSIPISTAISEFYLEKEIVDKKVNIYTMDQLSQIPVGSFDLATNIHSFSEMSIDAVEDWIKTLKILNVPKVFVVPNPKELQLNLLQDFKSIFEKYGYSVKIKRSKYSENIDDKYLVYPSNYFYLEL